MHPGAIYILAHKEFPYAFFFFFAQQQCSISLNRCAFIYFYQAPSKEHPGHFQLFALPLRKEGLILP